MFKPGDLVRLNLSPDIFKPNDIWVVWLNAVCDYNDKTITQATSDQFVNQLGEVIYYDKKGTKTYVVHWPTLNYYSYFTDEELMYFNV